jgi:hypothetical protein
LAEGIELTGVVEKFSADKHRIDTCTDKFKNKYICRIDGNVWYGSNQGMKLPRNQLKKLTIHIGGKPIVLDVSQMFNPQFDYKLNPDHFKLQKKGNGYYLYSFFSDGAGTYTVHWKIDKRKSTRVKISNDEKDFAWQTQ